MVLQEDNPKAIVCAGWLCFQAEKNEQALKYFTKAEELIPQNMNITYLRARCLLRLQEHNKAYDCLHKCLTNDPNNPVYWSSLGILFGELKQVFLFK